MDANGHLLFRKHWELNDKILYQLGQCDALILAISNIPLKPESRAELLNVSLIKGAQATTAIEGNTLTEAEIKKINAGWQAPPSLEYQEIEVKNIIDAFNLLLNQIVAQNEVRFITPGLIKDFHKMIGKGLGDHLDAIPGQFRQDNRVVGRYRAPEYNQVPALVEKLCHWIKQEFGFHEKKEQSVATALIQAVVTHVYIEWIHPFGDGNGRTGRLIEFYVLLRAGLPSIVSHILSNFYNRTRPEYYRKFDQARRGKDLTCFIEYAVQGFLDGLMENLKIIQDGQFEIFWRNYIFEAFSTVKYSKRVVFKRKRDLILHLPVGKQYLPEEIAMATPQIAKSYSGLTMATLKRDLKDLQRMDLIKKDGKRYQANIDILKAMIPGSKKTP